MSTPPEQDNLEANSLMVWCESLIRLLGELETPESRDKTDPQAQIASLGTLLHDFAARNGRAELKPAVQAYRSALAGVREFLEKSAASRSQSNIESQMPVEEWRKEVMTWRHRLLECQNTLLLTMNFDHFKDIPNTSPIQVLKEGLDGISRDVFVVSDEIFPSNPGDPNEGTFSVEESELTEPRNRKSKPSAVYLDCPDACFSQEASWDAKMRDLKLTCCCENVEKSHEKELQFKGLQETLLVAEVIPNQGRTWQMMLFKPSTGAVVLIRISKVTPTYVHRVQQLAAALALRYAKNAARSSADKILSESLKCRITAKSVFVQTMTCRQAFMHEKLPNEIRIEADENVIRLPRKPGYMQILHYSVAPGKMLEKGSKLSSNFLPEPHVELVIGQRTPLCLINPKTDETYTILSLSKPDWSSINQSI
ncbi:hypothetical protein CC80DRAFT_498155 [Byssothecium circinans]|uniref:Uncharacterized protein n=1 Tax=Byssothecium circinans TaxID=147558 RepID=A0A6A5T9S3_9PLEO|nr:hypothetical protein CC80DRAFT_498155 [Byssothecium circinans]